VSNIIPFDNSATLPAHIAGAFALSSDLMAGGLSFASASIKGKVFTIVRGEDRDVIMRTDANGNETDEPAASIEVVLLDVGPKEGLAAKVYYPSGYTEGDDSKPDCYSNDGVAPAANAEKPQCRTCAACPHNAWGSRIADNGNKVKACTDSKRLAIAPAGMLNDPMLLRVPPASLKALTQYNDQLNKRGVPWQAVVTKISFDFTLAHPQLVFKPVGFCTAEMVAEIKETLAGAVVKNIIGANDAPIGPNTPVVFGNPVPPAATAAPAPAPAAPTPRPTPAPAAPAATTPAPAAAPAPTPKPRRKSAFSATGGGDAAPAPAVAPAPVAAAPAGPATAAASVASAVGTLDDVNFDD
jgi:hypothetical protein